MLLTLLQSLAEVVTQPARRRGGAKPRPIIIEPEVHPDASKLALTEQIRTLRRAAESGPDTPVPASSEMAQPVAPIGQIFSNVIAAPSPARIDVTPATEDQIREVLYPTRKHFEAELLLLTAY